MAKGRLKGNNFEIAVCRVLSSWVCPGTDWSAVPVKTLPVRRRFTATTPMDGHWEGAGDLLQRPGIGIRLPFSVECKKHEGWELDGVWTAPRWPPWGWWAQCHKQARKAQAEPMLVFSRNRREVYVMVDENALPFPVRPAVYAKGVLIAALSAVVEIDLEDVRAWLQRKRKRRRRSASASP